MTDPQSFPAVLLIICFMVVIGAVVIAVRLESAAFRRRYRLRRGAPVGNPSLQMKMGEWMRHRRLVPRAGPVVRS